MRLLVRPPAPGGCGATPPPGCGALWKMAQLGKRARATPRQPAGRVAPGSADLGSESGLTERRTLPNRWAPECAFPSRRDRRMRLSVRVPAQNALFRKMRLSSPGQTWRHLTEKRTLPPAPHGKAHSAQASHQKAHFGLIASRIDALCVCWRTSKVSRPCEVSDSHTSRERCE